MNGKIKVISIIFTAFMLSALFSAIFAVSAQDEFTLTADSVTAECGDTVEIELVIENNPGIACLLITVPEIEGITLKDHENGNIIRDLDHGVNFLWSGISDSDKNGMLVKLTYEIGKDVAPGEYEIRVILRECINEGRNNVELKTVNGKITVEGNGNTDSGAASDSEVPEETHADATEMTDETASSEKEETTTHSQPDESESKNNVSTDSETENKDNNSTENNGSEEKKSGCGSAISGGILAVVTTFGAMLVLKRKRS